MAGIVLSEDEKVFILNSVEDDFRADGRFRRDYRPMRLETGVMQNANGSARVRLANTDVIVGVKTEIDQTECTAPDVGKIEFFVDCSANATPEFEGRGGEELAAELSTTLTNAFETPASFDLKRLCILPGQQCWKLYIDILILECGGNLFDAISIAVKAALFNLRIPRVTASMLDAGEAELILSDDPYDCTRLDVQQVPLLVTVCKIGDCCLVDPSPEEEACCTASVVVAVTKKDGQSFMTSVHTIGGGSLHKDTMYNCVKLGVSSAACIDAALMTSLKSEEHRFSQKRLKPIGFQGD